MANCLGSGFLEKVYENAVAQELRKAGLRLEQQRTIEVRYDGIIVGSYGADLLVEEAVLVELKALKTLDDIHLAQGLNYLQATGLKICLLLNFASPRLEIKRRVNRFYLRASAVSTLSSILAVWLRGSFDPPRGGPKVRSRKIDHFVNFAAT